MKKCPSPKVLVVDDNPQLLSLVARFLSKRGLEVITTGAAIGVRALILKHAPDVVVLDVKMPAMDGGKLARLIQESCAAAPRIVFFSAIAEEELRRIAQGCPGAVYVSKTEGSGTLHAAICALARRVA
jgi:DNA-binding response OmpR family regulator